MQQSHACFSQLQRLSVKQQGVQFVFKVGDCLADGRLGDMELFCSPVETVFLINGFEHPDFVCFDVSWHCSVYGTGKVMSLPSKGRFSIS